MAVTVLTVVSGHMRNAKCATSGYVPWSRSVLEIGYDISLNLSCPDLWVVCLSYAIPSHVEWLCESCLIGAMSVCQVLSSPLALSSVHDSSLLPQVLVRACSVDPVWVKGGTLGNGHRFTQYHHSTVINCTVSCKGQLLCEMAAPPPPDFQNSLVLLVQ